MKPPVSFQIEGGYVMRSATPDDRPLAHEWQEADDHHRGRMGEAFWTEQTNPAADTYVLEDAEGPVMYVRLEKVTRVLIQFPPRRDKGLRSRARRAMKDCFTWLVAALGVNGQCDLIFDSQSEMLKHYAKWVLGFQDYPGALRYPVPVYTAREPNQS